MQITLNQAEIESAISTYIANQIVIQDGMEVAIDLTATRGPEGFKATIDIVPVKIETLNKGAKTATRTVTAKPVEKQAGKEPEPAQGVETGTPATSGAAAEEKPAEAVSVTADPIAEQMAKVAADTSAVPAEKPRSLFASLKQPVNG